MADFFEILAQGRQGGEQWVTLLIFIVIVAVNVIGGIVKAAKSGSKQKDEESGVQPRRQYKPVQQWNEQETSEEEMQAEQPEKSPISDLEAILRERREKLQAEKTLQQRVLLQSQLQEQFEARQKAQLLEMKRQRLIEQKTLAEQRQKLIQQKEMLQSIRKPTISVVPEPKEVQHQSDSIYELANFPAEKLQEVLVACEIMGKPVSMRENDERLF